MQITPVQQKAANQLGAGLGETPAMIKAAGTAEFNLAINELRNANTDFMGGNQSCGGILMGDLGGDKIKNELNNASIWMRAGVDAGAKRLAPSLAQQLLNGADLLANTAIHAGEFVREHESGFGDVPRQAEDAWAQVINQVQVPLGAAVGYQAPAAGAGPEIPAK